MKKNYTCAGCGLKFKSFGGIGNHARHSKVCTFEMRFWARVSKGDGCWHWLGYKDPSGYGRVNKVGPFAYAHRTAWTLTNGPVPAGKDIMHRCDVRDCCNPAHHALGTQEENNQDMKVKGRANFVSRRKLNDEQILAIRAEFRRAPNRRTNGNELAAKYGVGYSTIAAVVAGRTWNNVTAGDE